MEAEARLPPANRVDNPAVDFRSIFVEREALGLEILSESRIAQIEKLGYDAYSVSLMNSGTKIGRKIFYMLAEIGRISLTEEYVVFHNFRDQLTAASRVKIAALLLREAQKEK